MSFNSRTREGCDPIGQGEHRLWGCFNSRTREGCDLWRSRAVDALTKFQFTHPGGVRLAVTYSSLGRLSFNSRTREGCDSVGDVARLSSAMFQFTHPGGVRQFLPARFPTPSLFQFTHPGGVRLHFTSDDLLSRPVSIHAPGRGATRVDCL